MPLIAREAFSSGVEERHNIAELFRGPMRFGDLKQALPGISAHTLTNRLRRFETYGIVKRTVYAEIPPRVEYELTEVGSGLHSVLDAMNEWVATVSLIKDDAAAVPIAESCAGITGSASIGTAAASRG